MDGTERKPEIPDKSEMEFTKNQRPPVFMFSCRVNSCVLQMFNCYL